jgi:hypothetical protein
MKTSLILTLIFGITLLGCSTHSFHSRLAEGPKIIFTTDGSKVIPVWVYEKAYYEERDRVFVSGVVDLKSDQNPSRGLSAADLQARAELGKIIETRVSSQLQLANEGFGYSDQILYQITNLASRLEGLQNVRIERRGYAQIRFQEDGKYQFRFTCYSQASVPKVDLDQMIKRSLAKFEKSGEISPQFRRKVEESWREFFESSKPELKGEL